MPENDPFTIVYGALWDLVEAFQPFAKGVRVGNRIKFSGPGRDPEKPTIRAADTPEVLLFPTEGTTNLCSTSSTTDITKNITFTVTTGDKRVNWSHNQFQFYILQAVSRWKNTGGLGALVWRNATFVEDVNVIAITEGITDDQLNKNIEGWASQITIQIKMRFAQVLFREP